MSKQRYEYKVAFVDFRGRVSVEGEETLIKDGERMTAFGRRYLNALGEQGWELVDIQMQPMGNAFHIFKRPLAEGEAPEPEKPLEKSEPRAHERPPGPQPQMFTYPFPGRPPYETWFEAEVPPPPPMPRYPGEPRDMFFRFVRRRPDAAGPEEYDPPAP